MAKIVHPNVLTVFDSATTTRVAVHRDGAAKGRTSAHPADEPVLALERKVDIIVQLLDGLACPTAGSCTAT